MENNFISEEIHNMKTSFIQKVKNMNNTEFLKLMLLISTSLDFSCDNYSNNYFGSKIDMEYFKLFGADEDENCSISTKHRKKKRSKKNNDLEDDVLPF